MVVTVAMVALWDEAILELEELVSTKGIAVVKLEVVETTVARLVKRKPTTLVKFEAGEKSHAASASAIHTTTRACILC